MKSSRSASSPARASASGRSANSAPSPPATSGSARRCAPAAGRPRRASVLWRMQVSTSSSGRSAGVGEADAVGGDERHAERGAPGRRSAWLSASSSRQQMALQLDDTCDRGRRCRRADRAARRRRSAPLSSTARPASATSPPSQPSSSSSVSAPSPFAHAQLHARDQPAEVRDSRPGLDADEQRRLRDRGCGSSEDGGGGRLRPRRPTSPIVSSAPMIGLSPAFFAAI